jgi:THO complex subunit 1
MKSPRELMSEINEVFFTKYLTNPKLLELQLSDANFRRSLLVQLLIVFQYLTATIKFKSENFELKPEQSQWVKDQTVLVYKLLAETPANSQKFADSIRHILNREELWSNWKNEGWFSLIFDV